MFNIFTGLLCFGGGYNNRRSAASITFQAINPDDCPISGAVYRLTCACGQYLNALTGKNGCATFNGVCSGTYTLTQVAAPYGYLPDPASHTVTVAADCSVKIDGRPMRCFHSINQNAVITPGQSDPPAVDPITVDTVTVTGEGIPGCKIKVIFPGGQCVCAVVRRDGTWSADVPDAVTLAPDDTISVTQTCACMLPSDAVSAVVAAP